MERVWNSFSQAVLVIPTHWDHYPIADMAGHQILLTWNVLSHSLTPLSKILACIESTLRSKRGRVPCTNMNESIFIKHLRGWHTLLILQLLFPWLVAAVIQRVCHNLSTLISYNFLMMQVVHFVERIMCSRLIDDWSKRIRMSKMNLVSHRGLWIKSSNSVCSPWPQQTATRIGMVQQLFIPKPPFHGTLGVQ
jgi:hypothetical protein